jgi:hypothetical protein
MTTSPPEPGPEPTPANAAHPSGSTQTPAIAGPAAPAQWPAYPVAGLDQPGYRQPPTGRKTGVIVTAVVALAAGVGIGAGAMALATDDDDPAPAADSGSVSRVPITTPSDWNTTTSAPAEPADGAYSMAAVTNACDLVDLTALYRWGATPRQPADHWENQPTDLSCQASFVTLAADQTHYNEAGINFDAAFTQNGADPAYAEWKDEDTTATGAGLASGDVTGLGTEGYWHSEIADTGTVGMSYIVAVRDDNVSVRVRLSLLRQPGEPPVTWEELAAVARPQVEKALAALRT